MRFWQSVAVLAMLQLLHAVNSSTVQLKNNGYEDLLIAINPAIPEDNKIIENIKNMMTEASDYLFQATKRRAFFRSVKILVPFTWTKKNSYSRVKTESFEKADVIVAKPFIKYGDEPYTLQYGGCGEPGRYIHFTPKFLLDDALIKVHGPRGRVLVHEWAHFRWGVFDEYNKEQPFYISPEMKVEATRCSTNIVGVYKVPECQQNSCQFRDCKVEQMTGVYEHGCVFIPEATQTATSSIMYNQGFTSVVEFCDKDSHNIEAPNLQNRMCNSRSTWEVIMGSTDFTNTVPMSVQQLPPPPTFSILRSRDRVVCLVLDVSGSMSASNRLGREHQATELFLLQILETGSYAGIVTFSSSASVTSSLRQIVTDAVRAALVATLPRQAGGGTNICAGLRKGFEVNKNLDGSSAGTEIILLTDGEDSSTHLCFPEITASGAIIHVIALGPSADKSLEKIAGMTGGLRFSATDKVDANGLIDAFSSISSTSGDLSQQSIQIESSGSNLAPSKCMDSEVTIDSTVGKDTFFVITWQVSSLNIQLQDPSGRMYGAIDFVVDTTSSTARLQIPGIAKAGVWKFTICNPQTVAQDLSITVTSRAASPNVPPVTVNVHMNRDASKFPDPMVVYAQVSQGFSPVVGAKVMAIIESEGGPQISLSLYDNGAGADVARDDGIYSSYFTAFTTNGRYSLKVRVQGKDKKTKVGKVRRAWSAFYLPGSVKDDGTIEMNPERPAVNDNDALLNLESFSRTGSGGSFTVTGVPSGTLPDVFPPSTITDLAAKIADDRIELTWIAPGGDLDKGQAARYDIRMSTNRQQLRDNFEKATSVNASAVSPQPFGSMETFSFVPENIKISNGTILYFSVRSIDANNLMSKLSNIAQSAMFVPPAPPQLCDIL